MLPSGGESIGPAPYGRRVVDPDVATAQRVNRDRSLSSVSVRPFLWRRTPGHPVGLTAAMAISSEVRAVRPPSASWRLFKTKSVAPPTPVNNPMHRHQPRGADHDERAGHVHQLLPLCDWRLEFRCARWSCESILSLSESLIA
jgi:hypothetical protein